MILINKKGISPYFLHMLGNLHHREDISIIINLTYLPGYHQEVLYSFLEGTPLNKLLYREQVSPNDNLYNYPSSRYTFYTLNYMRNIYYLLVVKEGNHLQHTLYCRSNYKKLIHLSTQCINLLCWYISSINLHISAITQFPHLRISVPQENQHNMSQFPERLQRESSPHCKESIDLPLVSRM